MLTSFLPQLINAFIALLTIRVYTEFLSPIELGTTMLILGTVALIDALLMSASNQTTFYFISRKETKVSTLYFLHYLAQYLKYLYFFIFISFFLLINIDIKDTLSITVLSLIFLVLYIVNAPIKGSFLAYLNFKNNRKHYALQLIFESIITITLVVLLLYQNTHWIYILFALLLSKIITTAFNFLFLKNDFESFSNKNIRLDKNYLIPYMQYMKSISLMGILGWISAFADRFIIASSLGVVNSGYYSIASGLVARPYNVLTATFTAYFRPEFYKFSHEKNNKLFYNIKIKWMLGVIIVGMIATILFYFTAGLICSLLLADGYREHIENILWLISIALSLSILTHVFDNVFLALGNAKKLLKIQLFLVPVPLIAIFFGAVAYGVTGAIIGRIFAELIKLFSTFYYSRNRI